MSRYRTNRILPMILILVIAVIVIVAIISLVRIVFFSGNTTSTPTQADTSRTALLTTDPNRSVKMTVRGPIVAVENFRSYTIAVTPTTRTFTTYTGYTDNVIDRVALANDKPSYEQFVHALDRANLAQGKQLTGEANDTRGRCATGLLYDFQILDGDSIVKEVWTTTCSGSKGSLDANVNQLLGLFRSQIPNSQQLLSKISLQ